MTDFILYLPGLLTAYGIMAFGLLSPGPNSLAIAGTAMERGRIEALAMMVGVVAGSVIWAVLAVTGLAAVLSLWAGLLTAIKIAGAAYLLYLAWGMAQSAASTQDTAARAATERGLSAYAKRGFLIQMTNPKALMFWIALGALAAREAAPISISILLVGGCGVLAALGYTAWALAFSSQPALRAYTSLRRPIQGALAGFFAFAAYRLATDRT